MRLGWLIGTASVVALGCFSVAVSAHEDMDELPAGPIRDRHVLMEGIGKNAKAIGDAMKAGAFDKIPDPAGEIEKAAKRIPELFPADSTHPKSRAKPEVWADPTGFAFEAKKLEAAAATLVAAAQKLENVPQAANELFAACKSCHTHFRVPEE